GGWARGGGGNGGGEGGVRRRARHEGAATGGRRRRLNGHGLDRRRGPGLLCGSARAPLGLFSFHAPHHTGQTLARLGSARCGPSRGWGPRRPRRASGSTSAGTPAALAFGTATNRVRLASSGASPARD